VAEAARAFAGDRVVLKWPNDVMADGKKLAGILAELRQGASGAELVLGVGLNVEQRERDFADGLAGVATSLRLLRDDGPFDRETLAAEVLRLLAELFLVLRSGGWPDVAARFLRYAPHATGRRVRLASGAVGVTSGLDACGALRVRTAEGIVLAHASESLTLLEE
jgi:BirA family biotin operon repressor/biotin-[acetyl-CoA-carboxylase] ligase